MSNAKEIHRRRIELFGCEAESWKQDHDEAMECLNLEATIRFGINILDSFLAHEQAFRALVLESAANGVRNETTESALELGVEIVRLWLKPAERLQNSIARFQERGYTVEPASDFAQRIEEAKWIVSPSHDVFNQPAFEAARDAAVEHCRESGD